MKKNFGHFGVITRLELRLLHRVTDANFNCSVSFGTSMPATFDQNLFLVNNQKLVFGFGIHIIRFNLVCSVPLAINCGLTGHELKAEITFT